MSIRMALVQRSYLFHGSLLIVFGAHMILSSVELAECPLCGKRLLTQFTIHTNEQRHEKNNVLVSDLVQHKLGCTATEDG